MTAKALISDLTWRSLAMQKAEFPDMPHYVAPDDVQEILRPTTRKDPIEIHVVSLAVVADNEKDFLAFITAVRKRKAVIFDKENDQRWGGSRCGARTGIVKAWKAARKNGVAMIGGKISAEKREDESRKACAAISDLWPLPNSEWRTPTLLKKANEAIGKAGSMSYNTAKKILGSRVIAQHNYQAALKRKARKNKIVEGLEAAVAYAKGDKSKGTLTRYRVKNGAAKREAK